MTIFETAKHSFVTVFLEHLSKMKISSICYVQET